MNTDLKAATEKIIQFRDERDWAQYHDPKNLAQALSIEAAELQEIFLWKTTEQSKNLSQSEKNCVKEELADIFIYLTYFCREFKFDLLNEVSEKIKKNGVKYPVEKSKGLSKKYNAL